MPCIAARRGLDVFQFPGAPLLLPTGRLRSLGLPPLSHLLSSPGAAPELPVMRQSVLSAVSVRLLGVETRPLLNRCPGSNARGGRRSAIGATGR